MAIIPQSQHSSNSNKSRRTRNFIESDYSDSDHSDESSDSSTSSAETKYVHSYKKRELPSHSHYVAMDCEMVGGVTGESICARVVLIDWKGRALLDTYVAPTEPIADYRTFVSGITESDLIGAPSLDEVQQQVQELIYDRILVGHALINDLACLKMNHPWYLVRDTAEYRPFMQYRNQQWMPRKLKDLAREKLKKDIQQLGQSHSPHEDAMAALNLYKQHRPRWEACVNSSIKAYQKQMQQQQAYLLRQQQYFLMQQQQHDTVAIY